MVSPMWTLDLLIVFFFTYDLEIVEIIYTGNATFKQQDPWVFSCKHQPKRNIRKIMGQKQNIITNPAFSLWEAKKRRLLRDTVPQLISWKQHKKRRLSQFPCISYKYSEYIHNIFIIYIHKCLKWLCPKDIIGYPPKKLSWGTRHLRITKMMFQSVGLGELGLHYLQKSNCQWNVRVSSAIPRSSIFFFNSCTPGGCWTVCLSMRDYGHFRTPLELSQLMKVCHPVP